MRKRGKVLQCIFQVFHGRMGGIHGRGVGAVDYLYIVE